MDRLTLGVVPNREARLREHLHELLLWYHDEIAAEAMFAAMARAASEAEHAAKWQTLARLERGVGERRRCALVAQRIALPSPDDDWQRGADHAKPFIGLPWRDQLLML